MPYTESGESPNAYILFPAQLDIVIEGLKQARLDWRSANKRNAEHGVFFPSYKSLERIMNELGAALFPLRLGPPELRASNENAYVGATLESTLSQLAAQIRLELGQDQPRSADDRVNADVERIIGSFAAALPEIRRQLDSDVEAGYDNDPAARSVDEVLLTYPSLIAVIHYRVAHRLHTLGAPLVARVITRVAQTRTGIDIHPGAIIGRRFFIDHGAGVVIGETAIVGDRVRLHQGVTLGGEPGHTDQAAAGRGTARHPIIEDDVVIHAGATILGRVRIGARSRIAGNVWLRQDVPPDSIAEPSAPTIRAVGE